MKGPKVSFAEPSEVLIASILGISSLRRASEAAFSCSFWILPWEASHCLRYCSRVAADCCERSLALSAMDWSFLTLPENSLYLEARSEPEDPPSAFIEARVASI